MAAKKNFTGAIATGADAFFTQPQQAQEAAEAQHAQQVHDVQDPAEVQEARKTQGVKGMKMPRVNLSLTPSCMDYLKTMAAISGKTYCQYIQQILEKDMQENKAVFAKAKELLADAR